MKLRLSENFRAAFYAPFYATIALGHFRAEGLDVELVSSAAPGDAAVGLLDGSIDVTWGGPMRAMKAFDAGGPPLMCFGDVVRKDPFYLVGRRGHGAFALADLARLRLGSVSEVPTPWLCLQQDLRDIGIDPARVPRETRRTMPDNLAGLAARDIDVAQMFEPFAARAVALGAEILYAASSRGDTAYTTFLATPAGIARHRSAFQAMTRALGRTQGWLAQNDAATLAEAVQAYFPDLPRAELVAAYARYMRAGIWASDTVVSPSGFARLAKSLQSGGFITHLPAYSDCVADLSAGT